jgi:hypothetical protein
VWITDSCYRDGVEIWEKTDGSTQRITVPYRPGFYLQLPDPALHRELLDALESDYGATECRFRTVYGPCEGWSVPAGRDVAMAIERQTGYAAQLRGRRGTVLDRSFSPLPGL